MCGREEEMNMLLTSYGGNGGFGRLLDSHFRSCKFDADAVSNYLFHSLTFEGSNKRPEREPRFSIQMSFLN